MDVALLIAATINIFVVKPGDVAVATEVKRPEFLSSLLILASVTHSLSIIQIQESHGQMQTQQVLCL